MTEQQYTAFCAAFVPALVREIMQRRDLSFERALKQLYTSNFYADFEDETSKLWRLSPLLLIDLWEEEQANGAYNYPEVI